MCITAKKISKTTHTHIFYMNCKESDSNDGSSFGKIDAHIIHTTYLPRKRVFAEEVEYLPSLHVALICNRGYSEI